MSALASWRLIAARTPRFNRCSVKIDANYNENGYHSWTSVLPTMYGEPVVPTNITSVASGELPNINNRLMMAMFAAGLLTMAPHGYAQTQAAPVATLDTV